MKKVMACLLSLCLLLGGVAMAESSETSELTYTYDLSLNAFPTNWNPHQYKTNTENDYMLRWITDSFFDFDYNASFY